MVSGSNEQPIDMANKIMLLDGDISMQIKRNTRKYPELKELYQHNRNRLDVVYNSHWDFLNSGSNLIRTNTYHAVLPYLVTSMRQDVNSYAEIVEKAGKIAKESVENYCTNNKINPSSLSIVGSCGCFGIVGLSFPDKIKKAHKYRLSILLKTGVDIISFEGIRSIKEANMLFSLIREYPNTKFLVMFDADKVIDSSYNVVNSIRDYYNSYSSQITAIGLNNVNSDTAKIFCDKVNDRRETDNLIPLVMCINKCNPNLWDFIHALNDNPAVEWQKIGLRYIGGGNEVVSDDIKAVHKKLNCS